MQIVEKSGEGLSRVYGVTIPIADLNEKLDARIAEISPQVQLKGFRPGKVPPAHVRKMYGKALMGEIVEQTLNEGQQQAISEAQVRPATTPDLKLESDMDKVIAGEADLSFELAVEVMPDFEPVDPATLTLTRPVYEPSEADIDEAVSELARDNRTYEAKTGKSAKAADGDMVVGDFVGRIDGETFEGGSGEDAEIIIGANRFIPGFEEQLTGAKAGDTVTVKVTFPEDYPVEHLKGVPAEFEVTVKEVRGPVESKPDDALAQRLGMPGLSTLRDALKTNLQGQNSQASRFKLKRALLDILDKSHDFPLPARMVEAEFDAIWRQVEAERSRGELSEEDESKTDEQLQSEYRRIAERRVRLGLVLAEIGQRHDVQVTDDELNRALGQEASRYPGQEREVFEFFRRNQAAVAQLRAPLYEEKVVDLIVSKAQVKDSPVSKEDLYAEDEMPEGYEDDQPKKGKKAGGKAKKAEAAAAEPEAAPKAKAKKAAAPEPVSEPVAESVSGPEAEAKPAKKAAPKKAK